MSNKIDSDTASLYSTDKRNSLKYSFEKKPNVFNILTLKILSFPYKILEFINKAYSILGDILKFTIDFKFGIRKIEIKVTGGVHNELND